MDGLLYPAGSQGDGQMVYCLSKGLSSIPDSYLGSYAHLSLFRVGIRDYRHLRDNGSRIIVVLFLLPRLRVDSQRIVEAFQYPGANQRSDTQFNDIRTVFGVDLEAGCHHRG